MEFNVSNRMSKIKGSAIREIFKALADPEVISLAGGNPAPELFPNEEMAKIAEDVLTNNPVLALQYGITEGYTPLRELVKELLSERENICEDFNDTIIVSGGQQGIELATKCLVNEGDVVIVEEPSFIGALNAFRSYGAKLVGVPVQEDGMDIDALKKAVAENDNVKIIYTIPTFQNPSGITMSVEKRKAVYEIAKENNIVIIEDNPYGELVFDGEKSATIKSMDKEGIVIYCGSYSKVLAPGLRIGFVSAHKDIVAKMVVAKQVSDVHTPVLTQVLAYEYIKQYGLDKHIAEIRELYKHKCQTMIDAIDKYFPAGVTHTNPNGGLFIWCDLNGDYDMNEIAKICTARKVACVPGSTFMTDLDKPCSAFRLNYSTVTDEKIEQGIKILGEVLSEIVGE